MHASRRSLAELRPAPRPPPPIPYLSPTAYAHPAYTPPTPRPRQVSRGFLNEHGERERGSLLGSLRECTGHFIRCIKPNSSKLAWVFEPEIASSQLLACGVLAAALVNRTGYPDRPTFDGFLRKYRPAGLTPPGTAERRGSSRSLVKRNSAVLRASVALVQDLAKRPFPFGYGLRELSSNFSISSIEIEVSADHAQPLHRRLRMRHQPKESRPARQDQPVPEHDFCIGVERCARARMPLRPHTPSAPRSFPCARP